jgi:hypothetical protein
MKNILLIIICLVTIITNAQTINKNVETDNYDSQGIVELNDFSKDKIYKKSLEWIALNYKSAEDVIQLRDEEQGKIIAKGNFISKRFGKKGWIRHTLVLDFKEGKFRYTYSDLAYYSPGSGEMKFESKMISKKKIIADTENDIKRSIQSLTNYIKNSSKKDDW